MLLVGLKMRLELRNDAQRHCWIELSWPKAFGLTVKRHQRVHHRLHGRDLLALLLAHKHGRYRCRLILHGHIDGLARDLGLDLSASLGLLR